MNFMNLTFSILGLIPLNSSNVTKPPDQNYTHQLLYWEVYFVFLIGVPLNLIVMYISFFDKAIQGNYKYLLGNVALCDILFHCSVLFGNFVYLYLFDNNMFYTPFWCTLGTIWTETFAVSFLNALPLISINRYCVIVLQNEFFTDNTVLVVSLLIYWPILYPIMTLSVPQYLLPDIFCGYHYWFYFVREVMLIPSGILVTYPAQIDICNVSLTVIIHHLITSFDLVIVISSPLVNSSGKLVDQSY